MAPVLLPSRPAEPSTSPLLEAYAAGDTLLSGPAYSLRARGGRTLPVIGLSDLPTAIAAELSGQATGLVTGAISFDGRDSHLRIPDQVLWSHPLQPQPCNRCGSGDWRITAVPAEEDYRAAVATARERIAAGDLDKVVLARSLELISQHPISVSSLLRHLSGQGRTFAVPVGDERVLIGASPELVVARHGQLVTSNPLAGSARSSGDPDRDRAAAAALLRSPKDRHEHDLVVQAIRKALRAHCEHLHVPTPEVVTTPSMLHLSTTITGRLRHPAPSALELAAALHPTPAVAGSPTSAACAAIANLEPVPRGYYAGLVGWQDATGDGEWTLALRCAELTGPHSLRLFAGAGIVTDSDPDAELAETSAKFLTMLRALEARSL